MGGASHAVFNGRFTTANPRYSIPRRYACFSVQILHLGADKVLLSCGPDGLEKFFPTREGIGSPDAFKQCNGTKMLTPKE